MQGHHDADRDGEDTVDVGQGDQLVPVCRVRVGGVDQGRPAAAQAGAEQLVVEGGGVGGRELVSGVVFPVGSTC
ncbi:hypothetical protein C0Q92_30760 [Streptomyces albidoflavus]|uniref:Uncharacterized protein n=1 Tax=Streptomyces albidoflavus TaxID=1886 RepID=A0A8G2DYN2_9ACTN|nr:hypothetical protein C0Q92_30760 [Streptomyces albidoflavus]